MPAARARRRNPAVGEHPDLFESGTTPIFVPIDQLSKAQLLELPLTAFSSEELNQMAPDLFKQIAQMQHAGIVEALVEKDLWNEIPEKVAEILLSGEPRELQYSEAWDSLSESEQEHFLDNNSESQELIEAVVEPFESAYKHATEPDDDYILQSVDDSYFNDWLQEHADELVERARERGWRRQVDELVEEHTAEGYSVEQVEQAIDEALRESSNYETEVNNHGFFVDTVTSGYLSVDAPWKAAQDLTPYELERAVERINEVTDGVLRSRHNSVSADSLLRKNKTFEADLEIEAHVAYDPIWSQIERDVASALEDIEPEDGTDEEGKEKPKKIEKPLEERIVHRFKDGSFVVELLPRELVDEGGPYACEEHGAFYPPGQIFAGGPSADCPKCATASPRNDESLHMCIGAPSQRYLKAAKKGAGKAWSLRTKGGKRKIAIFADLKADGEIRRIDQAKGKHNRLPGFEASKHGGAGREGKFKPTEVVQVAEFLASLGIDPFTVNDVAPGMRVAVEKMGDNQEVKKSVDLLKNISAGFAEDLPRLIEAVATEKRRHLPPTENPSHRHQPCRTCGGARGGFCS